MCVYCGDRIGIYESTIAVGREGTRRTSVAREPGLIDGDELFLHAECADVMGHEQLNRLAATRPCGLVRERSGPLVSLARVLTLDQRALTVQARMSAL